MSGMLSIIHLPLLANTAAGKIATAAFFAPFISTDPLKAPPPLISHVSILFTLT